MTFEEKSGQYSLFECIQLTEKKYGELRSRFTVQENGNFSALLAAVKSGGTMQVQGRVVMDATIFARTGPVTGVERVAMEFARQFLAQSKNGGPELLFATLDGNVFQACELAPMDMTEGKFRVIPAGKPFQFSIGDQFLAVEVGHGQLENFFTAVHQARNVGTVINLVIHDLIPIVNTGWSDTGFAVSNLVKWSQSLRFADRLIAVSRKVTRDMACYVATTSMVGLTPTRPLPVAYCPLGCDPLKMDEAGLPDLGFPVDGNTLIAVGTLTTRKGVNRLYAAMQKLWDEGREEKLVIVGTDIGEANTRRFLSSQPVFNQKLFLPGYISDQALAYAIKRCGALVCPSLEEGFGLPLVEAAALGCPVIARDIEIFRETSGGAAFFFENGEADKIADGLRKWFALTRRQQLKHVPKESLVTWRQSAEMLKAIMFQGAASFSLEVGIKATVNLAVPGRGRGIA